MHSTREPKLQLRVYKYYRKCGKIAKIWLWKWRSKSFTVGRKLNCHCCMFFSQHAMAHVCHKLWFWIYPSWKKKSSYKLRIKNIHNFEEMIRSWINMQREPSVSMISCFLPVCLPVIAVQWPTLTASRWYQFENQDLNLQRSKCFFNIASNATLSTFNRD